MKMRQHDVALPLKPRICRNLRHEGALFVFYGKRRVAPVRTGELVFSIRWRRFFDKHPPLCRPFCTHINGI
jgi:hypothetical protein